MPDRNRLSASQDEVAARESNAAPMSLFREWLGFYSDLFGVGGGIGAVIFFFMWVAGWLPDFLAIILVTVSLTLFFVSITAHAYISSRSPIESIGTWLPDDQKVLKETTHGTPDQDLTPRANDLLIDATQAKEQEQSIEGRQPEPNLVFRRPKIVKIAKDDRGRYCKNEKGVPAAIVEIKNDADVTYPVREVHVRANISFEATSGEHDFSISDAAWLEQVANEVSFRLGDTKALLVASGHYQVFAVEVKAIQRGINTFYEYIYHELTTDEYKVEVQLFANRPHKMVGKRKYRLIVRPELKIEEIRGISNAKILEDLYELKNEGSLILQALESHHVTAPYKEQAEKWAERVERYLVDNNMKLHALRFKNALIDYTYTGITTATTRSLFHWLYTRIKRLEEFIQELRKDEA
jgi:hypothetical protein